MLQVSNDTPFEFAIGLFADEQGVETLYITVKGSFDIWPNLSVADEQLPVLASDEYWGEPDKSSLKASSDIHLCKPSTDILVFADAQAPERRRVAQLDATINVAANSKTIRVFGDRQWDNGGIPTRPEPFEVMPLVYERAYGGVDPGEAGEIAAAFEAKNPVGQGFLGKRKPAALVGSPVPNLEDPRQLLTRIGDQVTPAGVAPIAPAWMPRKQYAGTYDEIWIKKRSPYLPTDFDSRFFNAASESLVCPGYLGGGEPITLTNMSEHGPLSLNVPPVGILVEAKTSKGLERPSANIESVTIDARQHQLMLVWRAAIPCDKKALGIEKVSLAVARSTGQAAGGV